jgi:hypothetical protein
MNSLYISFKLFQALHFRLMFNLEISLLILFNVCQKLPVKPQKNLAIWCSEMFCIIYVYLKETCVDIQRDFIKHLPTKTTLKSKRDKIQREPREK